MFHLALVAFAIDDPCNVNPDCNTCIKQQYCGWCSTPVVYRDGSTGAHCAGFSVNGSANPFVCHGVYSTVACVPGYVCGPNQYCVETDPGSGSTKDECDKTCQHTGITYTCDKTSGKCVIAPAGSGGSLDDCQKKCTPPPVPIAPATPSAPNAPAQNSPNSPPVPFAVVPGTPDALLGFWRGVQISNGYVAGEFDFDFQKTTVTITDPSGKQLTGITIQPLGGNPSNQVWVNIAHVGTLRFLWEDAPNGPETINIVIAHGDPDGPAPRNVIDALSAGGGTAVFALSMCIPGTPCVFQSTAPTAAATHVAATGRKLQQADHCSPQATCHECLVVPFCGWCSGQVKYQSGRIGAHCVGFDANHTDDFTCNGTYSTITCPQLYTCDAPKQQCVLSDTGTYGSLDACQKACFAAITYDCNTTTWQCEPTTPGHGSSLPICQDNCNKTKPPPVPSPITPSSPTSPAMNPPLPPVTPITPPVLIGVWRGVEIDNRYKTGEWDFNFDMNGGVSVYFNSQKAFDAVVGITAGGWLVLNITSGAGAGDVRIVNYQVANTMSVAFTTFAMGAPGVTSGPPDYNPAMTNVNQLEFVLVRCVAANCVFTPPASRVVNVENSF